MANNSATIVGVLMRFAFWPRRLPHLPEKTAQERCASPTMTGLFRGERDRGGSPVCSSMPALFEAFKALHQSSSSFFSIFHRTRPG